MLWSTDLGRLSNKECLRRNSRISLGRGNRIDIAGELGEDGVGKRRDLISGRKYREK